MRQVKCEVSSSIISSAVYEYIIFSTHSTSLSVHGASMIDYHTGDCRFNSHSRSLFLFIYLFIFLLREIPVHHN